MIKINRPAAPPTILKTKGVAERDKLCAEYDAGNRSFTFRQALYGDPSVKKALCDAQHRKCCFCESRVGEDGDVEHFRPKFGHRQGKQAKLNTPGYYWLAYEWSNLFLSCSACNQRHKRNLFPLVDNSRRAINHAGDVAAEEPLFIDPAQIDPEDLITFREEQPIPVNGSVKGKQTIEAIFLDRPNLNERRRDYLEYLYMMKETLNQRENLEDDPEGVALLARAEAVLSKAVSNSAEFAGMARAAAKRDFQRFPNSN